MFWRVRRGPLLRRGPLRTLRAQVERVEPSAQGGHRMAELILDLVLGQPTEPTEPMQQVPRVLGPRLCGTGGAVQGA